MKSSPRVLLLLAAVYNLLWGAWVVLFPSQLFHWAGMAPPNYLELWQAVGMIVGVYGIGYAIAAYDPVRHWPIVLVGLLGKLLGPCGMISAVIRGTLPWRFATLVCLTNDLLWWIPFFFILRQAWRAHRGPRPIP